MTHSSAIYKGQDQARARASNATKISHMEGRNTKVLEPSPLPAGVYIRRKQESRGWR